jgi:hypothetical protein
MSRFYTFACVALLAAVSVDAFTVPRNSFAPTMRQNSLAPLNMQPEDNSNGVQDVSLAAMMTASLWTMLPNEVLAAGPDWGIFEGRTGSLLHPISMASLLLLSLSTGYIGLQYRRQRGIGDEISTLKKTLPKVEAASISEALQAEDLAPSQIAMLQQGLEVEKQITGLQAERKELSSKGLRDKHFNQGTLLAFLGTLFAIEGPLNTYARAGKLFPGPHLYAGAGLVVLWAAAAACVPAMQKGNDTARSLHIGLNAVGTGLFFWQVVSGVPILLKVVQFTKWP